MIGVKLGLRALKARKWAASLPWYVWTHGFLILFVALLSFSRNSWRADALAYKANLDEIAEAQAAADEEARKVQRQRAAANKANSKGAMDDRNQAVSDAGRVVKSLRLRVAELERTTIARPLPRAGGPAVGTIAPFDFRLSLSDELALREQCEAVRIDRNALVDWEIRRLAIEGVTIDPATGKAAL